ncbi:MAG: metallophosphoesterase [Candidatus Kapabacteria bacterium]|nr:metallophosphoesterase [Candidatus Kapabacteria bacterium]
MDKLATRTQAVRQCRSSLGRRSILDRRGRGFVPPIALRGRVRPGRMNQQPNMLLFGAVLGTSLLLLDLYVLSHWTSFARKRHLNRWWYRIPWTAAATMFIVLAAMLLRRHFFRMDGFDVTLMGFVSLWYLPKFGIAAVLLVRDLLRGAMYLWQRFTSHRSPQPAVIASGSLQPAVIASGSPQPAVIVDAVQPSRRAFLGKAAWSVSAVPFVIVGRGMWSTLYDFRTYRQELVIDRLPRALDGIRIAQISDVHAGSFPDHRPFEEVRRILDSEQADLIVITGDFVNQKPRELSMISRELERLSAPYGVMACLGNHDHYNTPQEHGDLKRALGSMGVDLLVNRNRRIGPEGSALVIAGTDNTGFRQSFARLDRALEGVNPDDAVVLLAHDPTFWDKEVVGQGNIDLMLSGHTHGGQFGVQFAGFEWSPAQHVYRQWAGLYTKGRQHLYVNRGIGTVGPPMRIGIPPEVTIFTLRSAPFTKGLA